MKYDVIIIGSGFGGLTCAHLLSKAGKSVLVLERQAQPGGCIQSYPRHGLMFDTGLHYVGGLAEGQPVHRIFSQLGLTRLPWHRLDADGFDLVTIDGQTFPLAEGYENFVDSLAASFPQEREALQQYVQMLQQTKQLALDSHHRESLLAAGAWQYLTNTFHDPLLVNVLSGNAMKMELRQQSLPLFTFAHSQSSFIQSSWRLKGDGNQIVRTLTDDIRSYGGDIVCQAEAQELIEREGRITAVNCSNGETYEADTFISDIHPTLTFGLVHESSVLKRIFRRRMTMLENTSGMFTASLAIKPGALPYFNHNKFVYSRPNVWTFVDERGETDDIGGLMISCRVPEDGTGYTRQIDLMTPMPWTACTRWEHTTLHHRGEDYATWKEQTYTRCINLAETVLPKLGDAVEAHYTSTPLTYRDYTLTPCGSAFGVRKDYRNLMMTMLSPRTPLPNLLLTGQNIILHGLEGVAMTSLHTSAAILGDLKIKI